MGKVWKPVDTHTDTYDTPDGTIAVSVCNEQISFDFHGALARSLEWRLNHDERLCRLVPNEGDVPVGELMTMVDDLLRLTHMPDHNWDDSDYELQSRISKRYAEIEATLTQQKGGE